jgi:hypothetical protein
MSAMFDRVVAMENSRLTKPGIYVDQAGSGIRQFCVNLSRPKAFAFGPAARPADPHPSGISRPSLLETLRGRWRFAVHRNLKEDENETQ